MNPKFLRVFKRLDLEDIRAHLLICGDLSASCSKCKEMGLKNDALKCVSCGTDFKYVTFRNIKDNMPKIVRICEQHPELTVLDFDDFKRIDAASKAEEFFK